MIAAAGGKLQKVPRAVSETEAVARQAQPANGEAPDYLGPQQSSEAGQRRHRRGLDAAEDA
eukprot:5883752-Lingulodinium_polyedra.AAC.1